MKPNASAHLRLLLAVILFACAEAQTEPPVPGLSGAYAPSMLRYQIGGDYFVDLLSLGGTLTLALGEDSSLNGLLHLPAPWAPFWGDTSEFTLEFDGSWQASGDSVVILLPQEQSFFQNVPLAVRGGELWGNIKTDSIPGDPTNDILLQFFLERGLTSE